MRFGSADRFLLLVDREIRRGGLSGFQAVLAVELEGGTSGPLGNGHDADWCKRLAAAFEQVLDGEPRARARLARRFGVGPLALRPRVGGALPFRERKLAARTLPALALERLNAPLDPARDPPIDLEIESLPEVTRLALRFWHPVMDERGAELLLREIDRRFGGETSTRPPLPTPDPTDGWSLHERHAAFRNARKRLEELTDRTPFTPAAGSARAGNVAPHGSGWDAQIETLPAETTSAFLGACDAQYGVRGEGLAQVGLVFAALADLAADRDPDARLALPVSVQLRPPRARGPIVSNALSFLWYSLPAAVAREPALRAEKLRGLAREKVLAGEEREAAALLQFGRWLPLPIYRRELTRRDGSSRFSASISTLGELLGGTRELFGRRVRDALAITAFPDPGIGTIFSRIGGQLRITTLHAPTSVDREDARRLQARLVAHALELGANVAAR